MATTMLEMREITKRFPGVVALSNVSLTVGAGEIHSIVGENGAGKSTLIKVLTGVYPFDSGEIHFNGSQIAPSSPMEAETFGISTVYQEVNLIPHLSVAENIMLGRQPKRGGFIRWKAIRQNAEKALAKLDMKIDVSQELSSYSIAIQQMVAIARALDLNARLLILDEPTSSLDERETAELFMVMRALREKGFGIIFITHFLEQVYDISNRITVLRNGEFIGEYETAKLPRFELISRILGKKLDETRTEEKIRTEKVAAGKTFLELRGIGRSDSIQSFDMELAEGEVVGLAGLLGSGRTEIARILFGIDKPDTGEMILDRNPVSLTSPLKAISHKFALCPEDRKTEGIIPHLSVRENLILAIQAGKGALRALSRREQEAIAEHYIRALGIRTPSPDTPIGNLSGGNQQKVLLARWLATQPRLIILDEPTRGIDIGAKAEIEKIISSLQESGMTIIFISSELDETVRNCRRVVVLRDHKKIGELSCDEISQHNIMRLIAKTDES